MPPVRHTAKEEAAFMNDLFANLDHDFFTAVPSPDPSPVKRPTIIDLTSPIKHKPRKKSAATSPTKMFSASTENLDMAALVEGASSWDWGDMECDILSPQKKRVENETKVSLVVALFHNVKLI
jgi:DNA replication ATP-dependent helicase Dna2